MVITGKIIKTGDITGTAQINRQNEVLVVTIVKYFFASNLAEVNVF